MFKTSQETEPAYILCYVYIFLLCNLIIIYLFNVEKDVHLNNTTYEERCQVRGALTGIENTSSIYLDQSVC